MLEVRRSLDRGYANHGGLKSYHTFSFGDYYDPGPVETDVEILTYIISGELEHKDSLGNSSVLRAGDVQRWSAGISIKQREHNP